jgi:hypothetical protein
LGLPPRVLRSSSVAPPPSPLSYCGVPSRGLTLTYRGILRFAPPRRARHFFRAPSKLAPLGFLPFNAFRIRQSTHFPGFASPGTCRFQGFFRTLLAVCSCRTLWAMFQTQAFVGFSSSEPCSLQGTVPLSGPAALLPFTGRQRPRCGFRALLSLKSSSRPRRYSQR